MVKRKEDHLLLIGKAKFIDDVQASHGLFAMILRSPYAHARILSIDKTKALEIDGVVDVLDSTSTEGRYNARLPVGGDLIKKALIRPLAKDKVRYVGEPVAVVLARERYIAEDALDQIKVEYEVLAPCIDMEEAITSKALLHEEWGTNVSIHYASSLGNVEEAFSNADRIFREKFKMHRHTGTAIETRGLVASYDEFTKELTVWSNNQLPHLYRTYLAGALDLDENMVRVISTNIGGSYGTKTLGYPEDILIPLLSIIQKAPIKWIERREESFGAINHAREASHEIQVAVRSDGTILGVKDRIVVNLGAYANRAGPAEAFNSVSFLPGCYKFQAFAFDLYGVVTNKTPMGPYRGFGKSGPNFALEKMIDIIARELRIDPSEIRKKNFVEKFPHRNPAGVVYDSGSYSECLELALRLSKYGEMRNRQSEERKAGNYLGIGISCSIAPSGGASKAGDIAPYETVTVRISRDGKATVMTGSCGLGGTGHETVISEIVSETIGLNQSDVRVIEGDTSICPVGQGTSSDRSAVYLLSAAKIASEKLKDKILLIAATLIGTTKEDLVIQGGVARSLSTGKSLSVQSIARDAYSKPYALPKDMEPGLETTYTFSLRTPSYFPGEKGGSYYPCYANDCNIALVDVDAETGKVRILKYVSVSDCGKIINKDIVEGQLQGGTMAGLGGAMYEELLYDSDGTLLTTSFMDYLVPTAVESPDELESGNIETPSPITVLGSKGVGESGAIGVYAALANAVEDALSPLGVKITELPLKPEFVLGLIKKPAMTKPRESLQEIVV